MVLATTLTRIRWFFWTGLYRLLGPMLFREMGRGCWFEGWVEVPAFGGEIRIGAGVRFCRGVSLTAPRGGRVEVGDNSFIGTGVVISAHESVRIGRNCLLAEYVCIHDNDHVLEGDAAALGFVASPVRIGDNCWLGAHSILVRGASMERDCVLGAGAVLTTSLAPGSVAVGVPARITRSRGLAGHE